ncbi:alpha/beta fold hydrolase [Cohnella lupini]|uniref:Pimeloyl-ACP methyl ester carboxylesterase n=1 Tax=Cohnella lupini TaxID=1294267 RepID=A0A3D9IT14_9BACL|nr:alpha/beta hydrolase [Cohnella lupini]RED64858.1 pimeloyl-ACP methyl ester carboxylesterase [Cohnella lupini]
MRQAISKDGTKIAYDLTGSGPVVILVGGAFSFRKFPGTLKLADFLSKDFTVINYDRRGRGDSSDTAPYAAEREIEDIGALIEEAGGFAHLWGMSSGAVLALRAAASGLPIKKLALYQPPFMLEDNGKLPPADFLAKLQDMVDSERRGDAVKWFMTKGMGVPGFFVGMMRMMPGVWKRLKAVAHTLPYDFAIMGDTVSGKPLSAREWQGIRVPTLVVDGDKSQASIRQSSQAIAHILPNAEYRTLEGQSHDVAMDVLAPVLASFFKD